MAEETDFGAFEAAEGDKNGIVKDQVQSLSGTIVYLIYCQY